MTVVLARTDFLEVKYALFQGRQPTRRRDVDMIGLDLQAILDRHHGHRGLALEQLHHQRAVIRVEMLDDHEGQPRRTIRDGADKTFEGIEASG
mgnify:CR=1 FL=1